ncbi:hypothetical protein [Tolumonas lignilytica]|uniref:hypothetical protein n=1 Tax=Tolumonas lignilytica TaxID=1283284 RepID=UPI0004672B65|nr:hypothetical protein [Tolumonas lignilytica]
MAEPKQEKKQVDWESLETEYRAGILNNCELGKKYGVSEGAIRKKAKALDWVKDISGKIQARAQELVRKREVREKVREEESSNQRVLIEATAEVIADVQLNQRKDITRTRGLVMKMLAELEAETDNIDLFEQLGEMMRRENDKGIDKLNDLYHKVISLAGRSKTIKDLSDSLKTLVALERQAFNIPDDPSKVELSGPNGQPLNSEKMSAEEAYKALLNK